MRILILPTLLFLSACVTKPIYPRIAAAATITSELTTDQRSCESFPCVPLNGACKAKSLAGSPPRVVAKTTCTYHTICVIEGDHAQWGTCQPTKGINWLDVDSYELRF